MKRLLARVLPGTFVDFLFHDSHNRRPVNLYTDKADNLYMAQSQSNWFRVYLDEEGVKRFQLYQDTKAMYKEETGKEYAKN